jgi:hypothetical protein
MGKWEGVERVGKGEGDEEKLKSNNLIDRERKKRKREPSIDRYENIIHKIEKWTFN